MLTPIALVAQLGCDVPATPDAQEAREAAERELAREIYRERPSIWQLLWQWLLDHLNPSQVVPGVPPWLSTLIVIITAAALVGMLILLLSRATLARRRRARGTALFEGDERDSTTLTRDADAAAARHDWATAVVDRFRAIIRSLDERALVEDYPGMTAQEAGTLACQALLDVEGLHLSLHQAAVLFDTVRYGRVVSTEQQDEWMRQLAERVTSAAPSAPRPRPHREPAEPAAPADVYASTSPSHVPTHPASASTHQAAGAQHAVDPSGTGARR